MRRLKWRRHGRHGRWLLVACCRRRRCVGVLVPEPHGWKVFTLWHVAGPYGDFDLARQSAELRVMMA